MSRFWLGELGRGDDLVRQRQHQLGELRLVQLGIAQLLERRRHRARRLVADQAVGQAGKRALAALCRGRRAFPAS